MHISCIVCISYIYIFSSHIDGINRNLASWLSLEDWLFVGEKGAVEVASPGKSEFVLFCSTCYVCSIEDLAI